MKMILINGSPGKSGNTAKILQQVQAGAITAGAEAKLVHI